MINKAINDFELFIIDEFTNMKLLLKRSSEGIIEDK